MTEERNEKPASGPGDFEARIAELEKQIEYFKKLAGEEKINLGEVLDTLERKRREIYNSLDPWQKVAIARHQERPLTEDYIRNIMSNFMPLAGDRYYAEDLAIVGGPAWLDGMAIMVIGQDKGRDTNARIGKNFGMPHPEGYRKALRLMKLAERFNRPVVTFVDTPGAYPGIGAEERGQALAIAVNLLEMSQLRVPTVAVVIGEGGSGGALGIAVADRVLMMEYAIYSVISPEGCASILFRDAARAPEAARSLKLTARELLDFGVIDEIIPEPIGGAHRDPIIAMQAVKKSIKKHLAELKTLPIQELLDRRYRKYRHIGVFQD